MFLSNRNPAKIYYVFFKNEYTGKLNRVTTKTKMKAEAVQFLANFEKSLRERKENKAHRGAVYLKDVEGEVLKYITDNFTRTTLSIYRTALMHFKNHFNKIPLNSISTKQVEEYKSYRLDQVNKTTCNIELKTLKATFNLLIKWNILFFNPVSKVRSFKIPEKKHLSFTEQETKLITNNIQERYLKNLVLFALYTGCRISELVNIQVKDIDVENRILRINNKDNFKTKSGKNRIIPLSDNLYNLLKEILSGTNGNILNFINPESYLFTNNGVRLSRNLITIRFKSYLRMLNFNEKYHFHCLRHTFITNLIKAGVNINYVKEIAGHSNIQTTMRYIHITTNDLRDAVNKVNFI